MILFTAQPKQTRIMKEGFMPDMKYNWQVKSKPGFVYISLAYAPFYANAADSKSRALIKVEVKESALYQD